jgi:tellurite resistance protein TerC
LPVDLWIWGAFVGFVLAMLAVDLFVVHRDAHEVSVAEAARWSALWASLGLAFALIVWAWQGPEAAGEYMAGYLIEQSLSIDNIFVFALIFSAFAVPAHLHHRVLFWGVIGALAFRALFIVAGVHLLESFHWMVYVFGAFLIFTGVRMARGGEVRVEPGRNPAIRLLRRVVPSTDRYDGQRFWTRIEGRRLATPMLTVLLVVELSDIVFALDSIPAILAVTREPFLVFTSNAFAILGLRNLYFLLSGMMSRFVYLKVGLAVVLAFVGVKMVLSDVYPLPIWLSLAFIGLTLAVSILASLRRSGGPPGAPPESSSGAIGGLEMRSDDVGDLPDTPRTGTRP